MCLMVVGVSAQFTLTGIYHRDGTFEPFTPEQTANIAVIGSSGVVRHDANNFQFTLGMAANHNKLFLPPFLKDVP